MSDKKSLGQHQGSQPIWVPTNIIDLTKEEEHYVPKSSTQVDEDGTDKKEYREADQDEES